MTAPWTIGRRITTGFAAVLALLLVIGTVGSVALQRTSSAYEKASRLERLIATVAVPALVDVEQENVAFLRFLLVADPVFVAERDSLHRGITRSLAQLRDSAAASAAHAGWERALVLHDRASELSDEATADRRAGRVEEATTTWRTRVLPARRELRAVMEQTVRTLSAEARASQAAAEEEARDVLLLFVGLAILALAGGTAAGVMLNHAVTRPLQETTNVLSSSATEILAATAQQASGSTQSSAAIAETLATVDEVVQTSDQAAQRARTVADSAQRAAEVSQAGRQSVDHSVAAMAQVHEQVESIAQSIAALNERAQAIGDIISTVTDIAEQTHLLALNAAIEAARAGEHGRGFAVVAAEVRSLAEQSKRATVQVRQILGDIQRAATESARATDRGTTLVADGTRQVTAAGETIRALAEVVERSAQAAAQIAASAGQQAGGMSQIREAMANIHEAIQQTVASTRQSEHAAADLDRLGSRLVSLVGGNGVRPHA